MNQEEQNYLNLLYDIIVNGNERQDRTGVGTKSIFGTKLKFSLEDSKIPLLTTKKMFLRGIIEELLFFIRGETNTKLLEEKGVNIWKGNTSREFLDSRGLSHYPEGEMGPMYGYQWRNFGKNKFWSGVNELGEDEYFETDGVDQLANVIDLLKNDPYSRRIMVTAYNPQASNQSVLEPCHVLFQLYVKGDELSLQYYQRSVDCFLGLPFNICSYAILAHILAKVSGLKAKELIFVGGDSHLYSSHFEQAEEQINRQPFPFPQLFINKEIATMEDIEKLEFEDLELKNYQAHGKLSGKMAI